MLGEHVTVRAVTVFRYVSPLAERSQVTLPKEHSCRCLIFPQSSFQSEGKGARNWVSEQGKEGAEGTGRNKVSGPLIRKPVNPVFSPARRRADRGWAKNRVKKAHKRSSAAVRLGPPHPHPAHTLPAQKASAGQLYRRSECAELTPLARRGLFGWVWE